MSPALANGFLITGPLGKSPASSTLFKIRAGCKRKNLVLSKQDLYYDMFLYCRIH